MHSPSQADTDATAQHDEILVLKQKGTVRRSSVLSQASRLSSVKVSSLGESSTDRLNIKPTQRTVPDQHAGMAGKVGKNSVPAMPPGNRHKPWPRRTGTVDGEVVKYMSSVPSYLQPPEKGDNVPDKALNFGVLDWGRLEKWMYIQKQVVNTSSGDPPSCSSSSSSPFSTSGSSSRSDRSIGSPLGQMNQSPTLASTKRSSTKGRHTRMMEEQNSATVMMNPDTRTSRDNASTGRNGEGHKTGGPEVKNVSFNECPGPEIGNSSGAKKDDLPAFSHHKSKAQTRRTRESGNSQNCEQQCVQDNLDLLAETESSYQFSMVESMWDHLQENIHAEGTTHDSAMKNRSVEVNRKSFSGTFPLSDIRFSHPHPRISYSCPLSSHSQGGDHAVASCLPSENKMLTANAKGRLVKLERFTDDLSEKVVEMADRSSQAKVKAAAAPRRDLSPQRLLRAGLNRIRGSSSSEGLSGQQTKETGCSNHNDSVINRKARRSPSPQRLLNAGLNLLRNSSTRESSTGQKVKETVCSDNSHEDHAASKNRSRHSPLRRIFDPLKPKNQIPFPGPITSLPSHRANGGSDRDKLPLWDELQSANGSYRLSDAVNHSTNVNTEAGSSVHAEKEVASTRQALLKLSWKNGSPLFVFSSSDINILAATREKSSIAQNDLECIYAIFTAHEIKKKSGVWASQVHKNKKHDLVYNVVGQLKVSSSKPASNDSKNCVFIRKFVLYGGEQVSTSQDRANSQFKNELAAIVIQVQNGVLENANSCGILQGSSCADSSHVISTEDKHPKESSQVTQKNANSGLASMVAVLPSGVHGISSTGEPSPLIERWKLGGACDCGGWDEGCMLTILTGKIHERSSTSEQPCITDASHQIELFVQGEIKESRHAFSMITFKDGVYTVDFGAAISSLQAFAMCIAALHSRNDTHLSGIQCSMEAQTSDEQITLQEGSHTSYLPERPPLSPVGRA